MQNDKNILDTGKYKFEGEPCNKCGNFTLQKKRIILLKMTCSLNLLSDMLISKRKNWYSIPLNL